MVDQSSQHFYSPALPPVQPPQLGLITSASLNEALQAPHQPVVIGICGGSCSGKSLITDRLQQLLKVGVSVLRQFDFYYPTQNIQNINFDDPQSIDWNLLKQKLEDLIQRLPVPIYNYNMKTLKRNQEPTMIFPNSFIVIEGLFILDKPEIRNLLGIKIFVDCPDDVRLGQRVKKHILEYNYSLQHIIDYYIEYTKPAFEKYVQPSKVHADLIIPNYGTQINITGIDFIVGNLLENLYGGEKNEGNFNRLRYKPLVTKKHKMSL